MEFNTATKNSNQSEVGRRVGGKACSVLAVRAEGYSVLSTASGGQRGLDVIQKLSISLNLCYKKTQNFKDAPGSCLKP